MFENILVAVMGILAFCGAILVWWMDNGPHNKMD